MPRDLDRHRKTNKQDSKNAPTLAELSKQNGHLRFVVIDGPRSLTSSGGGHDEVSSDFERGDGTDDLFLLYHAH
jgi:hypothetical protein